MPKLYTFIKYFCVILWSCFVIAPFLWAISTSFKDFNSVTGGATYIPWLQFEPTLDGWSVLFKPGSQGGINIIGPYFNSIFAPLEIIKQIRLSLINAGLIGNHALLIDKVAIRKT